MSKRKRILAPNDATPKRAEQAEAGDRVVDRDGRVITYYKTDYHKNNQDKCVVPNCQDPMHDSKQRRTGAKGACRHHYMRWIRARSRALKEGAPVPPTPIEKYKGGKA